MLWLPHLDDGLSMVNGETLHWVRCRYELLVNHTVPNHWSGKKFIFLAWFLWFLVKLCDFISNRWQHHIELVHLYCPTIRVVSTFFVHEMEYNWLVHEKYSYLFFWIHIANFFYALFMINFYGTHDFYLLIWIMNDFDCYVQVWFPIWLLFCKGEWFSGSAGSDLIPHVITIAIGEVWFASSISSFSAL